MVCKHGGRISIVRLKGFHIGSILKKLFFDDPVVYEAGRRNKFPVNLDALPGVLHLFIGFRNVLEVREMYSHDTLFPEEAVRGRDGWE